MDAWIVSTFWVMQTMEWNGMYAMETGVQKSEPLFSILLGIFQVKLLGPM